MCFMLQTISYHKMRQNSAKGFPRNRFSSSRQRSCSMSKQLSEKTVRRQLYSHMSKMCFFNCQNAWLSSRKTNAFQMYYYSKSWAKRCSKSTISPTALWHWRSSGTEHKIAVSYIDFWRTGRAVKRKKYNLCPETQVSDHNYLLFSVLIPFVFKRSFCFSAHVKLLMLIVRVIPSCSLFRKKICRPLRV